jgi:predicted permease
MGWRRFLRRAQWDHERANELESYVQIETDENIAKGMSSAEAREAAQRKLGNTLRIREEIYRMNTIGFLDSLGRDLRYALRGMQRRPGFTAAVVLTLALGIGANTAIFSIIDGVLIKPLPYPNEDELISIWHSAPGLQSNDVGIAPTMYFTYRDENTTFQNIGLWSTGEQSVTGLGEPEQVRTLRVTYGTLQALGIQPMLGRWFSEADDTPGTAGPDSVILTYGYWQRRFGGAESVIGRRLTIDSRPSEVIGVLPAGFRFIGFDADIVMTLRFNRAELTLGAGAPYRGLARLKPGATIAQATADVKRMLPIWLNAWPIPPGAVRKGAEGWRITPVVQLLKKDVLGSVADVLWVLMGTVGLVLLIACANIANLMLVRADGRRQEFAVRAALGGRRARIAKESLVESLVFGLTGGALGLILAYAGLKLLVAVNPNNLPRLQEISINSPALAFGLVASLVSSLLFGLIPASRYTSPIRTTRGATRGASASRENQRTRNGLVVVQVALALVLLVSCGLMIRTFQALRNVNTGFTGTQEIQTARIRFLPSLVSEPERYTQMEHDILNKIASIPGVTSAAFADSVPMDGSGGGSVVPAEDQTYSDGKTPLPRRFKYVSPGYFRAIGTRLIAGRDITWSDIEERRRVAVISENFARELWHEPSAAIGKRIREWALRGDPVWRQVIGVVEDVRENGPMQKAPGIVYWPVLMENFFRIPVFGTHAIAFAIRSDRAGTESLVAEIRQAVWSVNPNLPLFRVDTMQELYGRSLGKTSFALVMLTIAGAMALGLGIIGLYGVISYVISQRTREIGIRLALGAEPSELKRMFLRQGLILTVIGILAGLTAAPALIRFMSSLLFGVGPLDPKTYIAVLCILLTAAALASYMAARRAVAVDPIKTLKEE